MGSAVREEYGGHGARGSTCTNEYSVGTGAPVFRHASSPFQALPGSHGAQIGVFPANLALSCTSVLALLCGCSMIQGVEHPVLLVRSPKVHVKPPIAQNSCINTAQRRSLVD